MHGEEPDVRAINEENDPLKKRQLTTALRKKGIFNENKRQCQEEMPVYSSERTGSNKIMCSHCKGFYSSTFFFRHKATCTPARPEPIDNACNSSLFKSTVVSKMHNDEIGKAAKTDPTILNIGERLFIAGTRKVNKESETRTSVMGDMRLLARLHLAFKKQPNAPSGDASTIFMRQHFEAFENAVDLICRREGDSENDESKVKHGLKHKLLYLIKTAAGIIKATYRSALKDIEANEIDYFLEMLKLYQSEIFGDAASAITRIQQEKHRAPEEEADDEDIQTLRAYITSTIERTGSVYDFGDRSTFIELRDALCARITLFNGRRGNEPSQMRISHFEDGEQGRWVKKSLIDRLNEREKKMFKENILCYLSGKRKRLVPIIIPKDCIQGMKILVNIEARKSAGVHENNSFLFPSTGLSDTHVMGWHCIRQMCIQARVAQPHLLTATKQRHRISTKYASLDLPEDDQELFYSHMGHSGEVNKNTYQHPLPILHMRKIGQRLHEFDMGEYS